MGNARVFYSAGDAIQENKEKQIILLSTLEGIWSYYAHLLHAQVIIVTCKKQ